MHSIIRSIFLFFTFTQILFAAETLPTCTPKNPVVALSSQQTDFMIRLPSNPTTGYRWFLRDTPAALQPVSTEFLPPHKTANGKILMGAPGEELWKFHLTNQTVHVPQQMQITLIYARSFEFNAQPETFTCQVYGMP